MTQEEMDNIYLNQVAQYERDRQLSNAVTLLQGVSALFVIIMAVRVLFFHKKA